MKARRRKPTRAQQQIEKLRAKLAEAQDVIHAIQLGEVDALVVSRPDGERIYTLKGAETPYRALVETINEGAATLADDGTVLYCNRRLSEMTGVPHPRIVGNPIRKLIPASATATWEAIMAQALAGKPSRAELEFWDGRRHVPVYVSLRDMKTDEYNAICMVATDLTEQRKRDHLLATGVLAHSILQSTADAIAVCDEDGRIIVANEALKHLCCSDPLFQPFDLVLPLQDMPASMGQGKPFAIGSALNGEHSCRSELVLDRAGGERAWLLLSVAPLEGTSGTRGFVVNLTDITDRKQAEEALLRSEKLASVGRMTATIAHEINNPLSAVANTLFLARSVSGLPETAVRYLETADEELRRVSHITHQTLGFYHGESSPAPTSISAVLDSAVHMLKSKINAKRAIMRKRCNIDAHVTAVEGELRQVFSNLLMNSLDAIDPQGTVVLRVSVKPGLRQVRITVADNGKGMDASIRPRIFEPFFTTKGSLGSGIGLWVSKQLVNNHGGRIQMRSNTEGPRRGTTISVLLPAVPAARSQKAGN